MYFTIIVWFESLQSDVGGDLPRQLLPHNPLFRYLSGTEVPAI